MRLRDRFKNELAFSRYLQGSSTFRAVVERELGLKLLKSSSRMLKEVHLYKRPHRLDFPLDRNGYVDYQDPVVRAANQQTMRADLILLCEDFQKRVLVENQFGLSDLNHRKRLMEYYNSTQWETKPDRDDWTWVFWIAEDFREQDVEWVREHGHPIAMFKAWPKGNSVSFQLVYAPIRIDEASNSASQPVVRRKPEEW